MKKILASLLIGTVAAFTLSACIGSGSGVGVDAEGREPKVDTGNDKSTTSGTVAFADVQTIFNQKCTSCHGSGGSGGLNLTAGNAYNQLINVNSQGSYANRAAVRVVPKDADNSLLYVLIKEGIMPQNGALSDTQIKTIKDWIAQGAGSK